MSYLEKLADDCCLPLEDLLAISKDDFYELSRNVVRNSVIFHARAYQEWKNAVEKTYCVGEISSNINGSRERDYVNDGEGYSTIQTKCRYVSPPENNDASSVSCSSASNYADSDDGNAESNKRKRITTESYPLNQTEFQCALCKKKFTALKKFNKHVKKAHKPTEETGELPVNQVSCDSDNKFECDLCDKCFATSRGLNIHRANCRKSSISSNTEEKNNPPSSDLAFHQIKKDPNQINIANLVILEVEGRKIWIPLLYFGIHWIKFNHIQAFQAVMMKVLHYVLYHGGKRDEGTNCIYINNDWSSYCKEDQLAINHILVACTMSDYGGSLTRTSNRLSMYVIKRLIVSIDSHNFLESFQLFPTRPNGLSRNEIRIKDIKFSSGEDAIREAVTLLIKTSDKNNEWNPYDIPNINLDNTLNFSEFKNWAKQTSPNN